MSLALCGVQGQPCEPATKRLSRKSPVLGNQAKWVSTPEGEALSPCPESALERRHALRRAAAELVPDQRVAKCGTVPTGDLVHVVHHAAGEGSASFSGLQTCGSVWACPCCASKVTERRREELQTAITEWESRGGRIVMVTFTVRHNRRMSLADVVGGLMAARRRMLQGRAAQAFDASWAIAGRIRAVEVTHGQNGWHPHLHELWFIGGGVAVAELVPAIKARWSAMVQAVGLDSVNQHGCSVCLAEWSAGEYVAKFGRDREVEPWGVACEMVKANIKSGREQSRTPMGLLAAYAWEDDLQAAALWIEYAREFKGRRQLSWSRGLRELLGMVEDKSDEELAAEERETGTLLVTLTREEWRSVVGQDLRAVLLEVAASGSSTAVGELLMSCGIWRSSGFS